jgi:hypothetical protein
MRSLLLPWLLLLAPSAFGQAWRRTAQPPLDEEGLLARVKSGIHPAVVAGVLGERRCACDVSPGALARLKEEGVPDGVLAAASLHALPPNRRVVVESVTELVGRSAGPVAPAWLHLFLEEGGEVRAWHVPLGEAGSERGMPYRTGPAALRRWMVREAAWMSLPLRQTGLHRLTVAVSSQPWVDRVEGLTARERAGARRLVLDVPRSSPRHGCRLWTSLREDPVLPGQWRLLDARLDCQWE